MTSAIDMVDTPSVINLKNQNNSGNNNGYDINKPTFNKTVSKILSKITPGTSQKQINISDEDIHGNCDSKCSYNFVYPSTVLVAKNNGTYLTFTCEEEASPPVTYNNIKYNVTSISIYAPSIHLFNGDTVAAEIVIEHNAVLGGKNLYVSIPMIQSSSVGSAGSIIFDKLITEISQKSPGSGDTSNLSMGNFTLEMVVPKKPFYTYSSDSSTFDGDFIVFDKTSGIPITPQALKSLSSMIKPSGIKCYGGYLFYNPAGPNHGDNDIYISCHPTGASKDTTTSTTSTTTTTSSSSTYDWSGLWNSQGFIIFLICIGLIILMYSLNYAFAAFSSGTTISRVKIMNKT